MLDWMNMEWEHTKKWDNEEKKCPDLEGKEERP